MRLITLTPILCAAALAAGGSILSLAGCGRTGLDADFTGQGPPHWPDATPDSSAGYDPPDGGGTSHPIDDAEAGTTTGEGDTTEAGSIPQLADCLHSPYAIHVVTSEGYGHIADGVYELSGNEATWSGRVSDDSVLQLFIEADSDEWEFGAATDFVHGQFLASGTYPSGDRSSPFTYAQVKVKGTSCGVIPKGSFTLVDYESLSSGGTQATLTRLLAYFELKCDTGTMRGCVRYEP